MKLKIKTKHYRKATDYVSNDSCPIAEALKEKLKLKRRMIHVEPSTVYIVRNKNRQYDLIEPKEWENKSHDISRVNTLIEDAKNGKKVGPHIAIIKGLKKPKRK